ncbi:MAG: peptidase, partial [Bacteroidota bacterium]|nr:peptidase [Bacteroidota bacterium]
GQWAGAHGAQLFHHRSESLLAGRARRSVGTVEIGLQEEILPHSRHTISIQWHYPVNTGSPQRTGMVDTGSYFIAYFFPRVAVYDDLDGWDTWSYNGIQEFYNDFGDFHVFITVPKNYVVWATGDQVDPQVNFSSAILGRLKKAWHTSQITPVIWKGDYQEGKVFAPANTGVWEFKANQVTDFAFAISDHYLSEASSIVVDSLSGRRTLATAAFNPIHEDYYDVARQAHESVYLMSFFYPKYPFPFDKITIFDGTDQMEYPMMVNDNPTRSLKEAVQLTSHEIFHSYFPFYMGINETAHAWMDEGWASIGESVISPVMGYPEDDGIFQKSAYQEIAGTDQDVPLITNTELYTSEAYYTNSYGKGALCYYTLENLLGEATFFKALHYYMNTWHGKHPSPYDFFYCINKGSGQNLDWFWNKWFFGWSYPDLSIRSVTPQGYETLITVENKGGLPLPVHLTLKTSDSVLVVKSTAEVWDQGQHIHQYRVEVPMHKITEISLGDSYIPDKYPSDNLWKSR